MDYEDYMDDVKSFAFLRDDSQEHSLMEASSPSVSNGANLSLCDLEKVPSILNGEYFQIVEETKNSNQRSIIVAVCQLCINRRAIRGSGKVTSNFIQHLKTQHPIQYEEYVAQKRKTPRRSRNYEDANEGLEHKVARPNSPTMVDPLSATDTVEHVPLPEHYNLPTIFNGKYFKIVEGADTDTNVPTVVADCQLCGKRKWIQGNLSMTSNFVRHLKTTHPHEHAEYMLENGTVKRIKLERNDRPNLNTSKPPQISEPFSTSFDSSNSFEQSLLHQNTQNTELDGAPSIINGKYFKIVQQHSDYASKCVTVACQMCTPTKHVRGTLGVSSNFLRHLKEVHPQQHEEYMQEKRIAKRERNFRNSYSSFDDRVLRFIVDTFSSISIVELPSFERLFNGTGHRVSGARHMLNMLNEKFNAHWETLKDTLRFVPYVCTTADIWTANKHTFFGYACHWIDFNLKRQSAVLCCTRRPGTRIVHKIGKIMDSLNTHFELNEDKVMYTFTDNGGNFLNAGKGGEEDEFDNDLDHDEDIKFLPYPPELQSQTPRQHTCRSYSLNYLATTDYNNILSSNATLSKIHQQAFDRCHSVWRKCRDDETEEITYNILNCILKLPNSTSWSSLFIALSELLLHKSKLEELCTSLQIALFSPSDLEYLEEYCQVMKPIGEALSFLQKEENMYYGYFLPTLITIKIKLQKLEAQNNLKYLSQTVGSMKCALIEHFRSYFEVQEHCYDAVVAAMSCPSIKLKFLPALKDLAPSVTQDSMSEIFINFAKEFETVNSAGEEGRDVATSNAGPANSFFDFSPNDDALIEQQKHSLYRMRLQLLQYLEDGDCSHQCLDRYPIIRKVFLKYNTPLPSSAAVELLFGFDSGPCQQMFRHNLSNQLFEKMSILKSNKAI